MFCEHFRQRNAENAAAGSPLPPLPTIIVYGDNHAYRRALRALASIIESDQLRPMMWRFGALETLAGRSYAALDLAKAEILVVATSRDDGLPAAIEAWIQGAMAGLHRTSGTVIALLGSDRRPDRPTTPRYQLLQRAAFRAGWDFFAPNQPVLPSVVPCARSSVAAWRDRLTAGTPLPLMTGFATP